MAGGFTRDLSEIKAELLRVYHFFGRPFSRAEFKEQSRFDARSIEKRFGGWNAALRAAGLDVRFEAHKRIEAERKSFDPDKAARQAFEAQKAELIRRSQERDDREARQALMKRDIFQEALLESIAKTSAPVVEIQPISAKAKAPGATKQHVTLVVQMSDLQLGTLMTSEEMGGLNEHNWKVWRDKLTIWKTELIRLIDSYASRFIVDHVVIFMMGDMVEGQDIFAGQKWQIDRHVCDQAIDGANDTAGAMIELIGTFPNLKFRIFEVFGNHGREGRKGENPFSCSWDKVYQRFTELQVSRVRLPNCTWHQNETWFQLVDIYGKVHLIVHGDRGIAGIWGGRPTINSLEKGVVRYSQMTQQHIHFLHCGHFHQNWQVSFNRAQLLINGSWIGTSSFSAADLIAASPAVQMVYAIDPRVGLLRSEFIYLTRESVFKPLEPIRVDN